MSHPRESPTPLGAFLRARREQIRPEQAGLPDLGRRRVPGLRREELAMLAGVSVDYYVRLEQGRNDHPSAQVLDAIARVLQLDVDSAAHLRALAEPPRPKRRAAPRRAERVSPLLMRTLLSLEREPAFVLGRYMDVLAVNPLMEALNDAFCCGSNIVRGLFLNPAARDVYPDWDTVANETVASLRASIGTDWSDPGFTQLVGELSVASEDFRQRWARHDVRPKAGGVKRILHPMVGELELPYETFMVGSAPGQQLGIYSPEPGSQTAERLAMLAALVAESAAR